MGEETRKIIEMVDANEREWRQHILDLLHEIRRDVKAQNGRVGKLENWRWYLIGIFTAIGAANMALIKWVLQ